MRRPDLIVAPIVLLVGCATVTDQIRPDAVEVADSVLLSLPAAEELNESLAATQVLTGTYDSKTYTMQVELEWRPGSIGLAALNSFGALLFSMSYDGDVLETRGSPTLMQGLRPEYVLADILMAFWERSMLEMHLNGAAASVRDTGRSRAIDRDGTPIITIDYESESRWDGRVHFVHMERGYELLIQTVSIERT